MASGDPSTGEIFNVPERNSFFTGRDLILLDIRDRFMSESRPSHVQTLYGLGGIGKTQIAIEYAHRYHKDYGFVWWMPAEERTPIELLFARLASRLDLKVAEGKNLDTIRHVLRRQLAQRNDWLLIFDNANTAEELADFIPKEVTGHILITSRSPDWDGVAHGIQIREWERTESIKFLRARTGRNEADLMCFRLAQALGDLPLALEQAAAIIEQTKVSFSTYLKKFETHWSELLKRGREESAYPDSLAMAWELSFRQVEADTPDSAALMNLCAFFAPEGIPKSMLAAGATAVPSNLSLIVRTAMSLNEAIEALRRYSLVETDDKTISLHRLVGAIVRDRLSTEEQTMWATAAVRVVKRSFNFDSQDPSTWSDAALMVPHARSAAENARQLGVAAADVVDLMNEVGRVLLKHGRFKDARKVLEEAFGLAREQFGPNHATVANVANNLGRVLQRLQDPWSARPYLELALGIDQEKYGDSDPHVATVANNYGLCLYATGELDSARHHFDYALSVFRLHYPEDHGKIASVMNNLGFVLLNLNKLDEAQPMLEQALAAAESGCGAEHPTVASILHNLGSLSRRLGDNESARNYFRRALVIDETNYGPRHPEVARHFVELGQLMRESGNEEMGRAHLERALEIATEFYGDDHQHTKTLRDSLKASA
jgi:Tfp pilus assembly protein PilF